MSKPAKKEKLKAIKLRIAIINDESHEELSSFKTTRSRLIALGTIAILLLIVGTYFLTSRTFLKHTIPGYPSEQTKRIASENLRLIDSLEQVIDIWSMQIENIRRVATGREILSPDSIAISRSDFSIDDAQREAYSRNDSVLREQVRKEEQFNLSFSKQNVTQIEGMHFYTPVQGMITESYNKAINHPFIDIAASQGSSVCSVLDGTVISAVWNDETGYTIEIQHSNDIISVYRHNEKLLKKTGDKVSAGTPVALVGNSGSLSTGAHLHFELWYKGEAIDPTLYISF